jgi:hypothetical protein
MIATTLLNLPQWRDTITTAETMPGKVGMMNRLEYTTAGDTFFDFCLWEYTPVAPFESKLRAASMLFHSFEFMGIDEQVFELVKAIRSGFGVSNTVWGVKKLRNNIAWEFYFYDYRRRERKRSITKLLDIVHPFADCDVSVNENPPISCSPSTSMSDSFRDPGI